MKNQGINTVNGKTDFKDLKNVKNPIYQPMAGKTINNPDNISANKNEPKEEVASSEIVKDATKSIIEVSKNAGAIVLPAITKAENPASEKSEAKSSPTLNLEGTLKLVEELHRRMVQRGRLVHTINNLDKFEIEQKQEAEDTTSNYYQGCEIEITDDKRNKFSTKNPVIIKAVALFVRDLCTSRLAEIEAEIKIPA
ncbi:hypothetical protein [Pedobacter agri]|uniref:hypothetical protein n=1 Tax=Pedobacter agri TaxID=454586 RepID=UPI00292D6ECB|nr:hypothetical protein [Pedobacter agri]